MAAPDVGASPKGIGNVVLGFMPFKKDTAGYYKVPAVYFCGGTTPMDAITNAQTQADTANSVLALSTPIFVFILTYDPGLSQWWCGYYLSQGDLIGSQVDNSVIGT